MAMTQARREELARIKGFTSYHAERHASPAERAAAQRRVAAVNPGYARAAAHQIGQPAKGGRRQIFETPAGAVIASSRNDVLLSQIRQAAGRDEVVRARFNYRDSAGQPASASLWKRGGYSADQLHAVITSEHTTARYPNGWVAGALARFASNVYGGDVIDPDTITDIQLRMSPT